LKLKTLSVFTLSMGSSSKLSNRSRVSRILLSYSICAAQSTKGCVNFSMADDCGVGFWFPKFGIISLNLP
jgi:hypothetical protein